MSDASRANTITAAILAANNESEISDCLASVAWADQTLVVLDTRSADRTAALALERGARVLSHPFHDFASQRNYALEQADSEWVFFLDTDEQDGVARRAAHRLDACADHTGNRLQTLLDGALGRRHGIARAHT